MSEPDIKGFVSGAVPVAPEPDGWADSARELHRRRRGTRTAAAAVALVALVVPAGVVLATQESARNDSQSVHVEQAPDGPNVDGAEPTGETSVDPCLSNASGWDGVELAHGAASVVLCPAVDSSLPLELPAEPLVTDLDSLVDIINSLPPLEDDVACTEELGAGYQVVVTYPDREDIATSLQLYGCHMVGSTAPRAGAGDLDQALRERYQAQREQPGAPVATPDMSCTWAASPAGSFLEARLADAESAAYCPEGIQPTDATPVSADVVTMLQQAHWEPAGTDYADDNAPAIIAYTGFGDRIVVQILPDGTLLRVSDAMVWLPDDATASQLEDRLPG
ncbi:MAG: hypothetical protein ACK5KO_07535 [Arachnia sp.]